MSEELNKFVIVQAVSSKSVHGCFVENVEVYGLFDSFSEAYEYAHKNKLGGYWRGLHDKKHSRQRLLGGVR
jgi:hypothetical protein